MLIVTTTMVAAKQEQRNLDQYAKQPSLSNVHEKNKTKTTVYVSGMKSNKIQSYCSSHLSKEVNWWGRTLKFTILKSADQNNQVHFFTAETNTTFKLITQTQDPAENLQDL